MGQWKPRTEGLDPVKVAALTQLDFRSAAEAWLESRRPYISPKTFHEYQLNIKTLSAYFGEMRLPEISADLIRSYQKMRLTQCGPFSINHECSVLQQMLKRIDHWKGIAYDYQPLPLPKESRGRALRDEEKKKLLEMAASNPNWEGAYLFAMISVNTGMGPKETYTLRLKDVDLPSETVTVQPGGAKNVHRVRRVPLNQVALAGIRRAIARAKELGAIDPNHYLFPFRIRRNLHNPNEHQTTFKTAWKKLTTACGLQGLRMYDLRHTFATVSLENGTPVEILQDIMGHVARRTILFYSHPRLEARRRAVELHCPKKPVKLVRASTVSTESTEIAEQLVALLGKLLKTRQK